MSLTRQGTQRNRPGTPSRRSSETLCRTTSSIGWLTTPWTWRTPSPWRWRPPRGARARSGREAPLLRIRRCRADVAQRRLWIARDGNVAHGQDSDDLAPFLDHRQAADSLFSDETHRVPNAGGRGNGRQLAAADLPHGYRRGVVSLREDADHHVSVGEDSVEHSAVENHDVTDVRIPHDLRSVHHRGRGVDSPRQWRHDVAHAPFP